MCVPPPNTYTPFVRSVAVLRPSFSEVAGFFVFDRDTPPIKLGQNVSDLINDALLGLNEFIIVYFDSDFASDLMKVAGCFLAVRVTE